MPKQEIDILSRAQIEIAKMLKSNNASGLKSYLSSFECPKIAGAIFTPPTIENAIVTIIKNISFNKYIFSIVITACLKKLMDPDQDIRIAQDNMKNGYSNRSLDQRVVTPFLKKNNYTHCEASGLESGRNLERPLPWNLSYPCKPRGRSNRESFLSILDFIQARRGDPWKVLLYMFYLDATRRVATVATHQAPLEHNIERIMRVFERHFVESSGQGKSRLPVLAIYSIYESLIKEVKRYEGMILLPLERHTTADLRSGSIGDIQVNRGKEPFEGVEVKSEKPITVDMINELLRKFSGRKISRYYILTTFPGSYRQEDLEAIEKTVAAVQETSGCQVIVNGLNKSLWYYIRLLSDPSEVLKKYAVLLGSDADIRPELVKRWNNIIQEEYPGQ